MTAKTEDTVLALLDAWNSRDLDRFVEMLTDDIEWFDMGMVHPPARGRLAVRAFSESVLTAFPDFTYVIEHPICISPDGGRCIVVWKITATHTRVLKPPGFAPTHRRASFQGVDILEFREGQISRILTLFDVIAAAEQLTGMALRFPAGSFREHIAVFLQRIVAFFSRRRPSHAA